MIDARGAWLLLAVRGCCSRCVVAARGAWLLLAQGSQTARTPRVEEQRKIRSVHRAVVVHIGVSVCGAPRGLRATSVRNLPRDLAGGRIRAEFAGRTRDCTGIRAVVRHIRGRGGCLQSCVGAVRARWLLCTADAPWRAARVFASQIARLDRRSRASFARDGLTYFARAVADRA